MALRISTTDIWRVLAPVLLPDPKNPAAVIGVIEALIQIADAGEQRQAIEAIGRNVNKLVKMHMSAGKDHLSNALATTDERDRNQWLNRAIEEFIRAKAVEEPPENITAMIFVATCFSCLGNQTLASRWYGESFNTAHERHKDITQAIAKVKKSMFRDFIATYRSFTKNLLSTYVELFDIENKMRFLAKKTLTEGPSLSDEGFIFLPDVMEIDKRQALIGGSNTGTPILFALNKNADVLQVFDLLTAERIDQKDIRGVFRK